MLNVSLLCLLESYGISYLPASYTVIILPASYEKVIRACHSEQSEESLVNQIDQVRAADSSLCSE